MFPSKGTTVWVNFRGMQYLGKVLQTSPELDMVCIRISNYLDHVSRHSKEKSFVSHSCPDSKSDALSSRHSSIIITCGLADICPVESGNPTEFARTGEINNNIKTDSDSNSDADVINIGIDSASCNLTSSNRSENVCPLEDDGDWSESFKISKILEGAPRQGSTKSTDAEWKLWHCKHCNSYLSNENDMVTHATNAHKLESLTENDNWVVVGGIKGLDYDEIVYPEDNIKSLNNIHLSNSFSRKRQFFPSAKLHSTATWQDESLKTYHPLTFQLEVSSKSDLESSSNEVIHNPYRVLEFERHSMVLHQIQESKKQGTVDNDYRNRFFQNVMLQNNIQSFYQISLNNALPPDGLNKRIRAFSISDHQPLCNNIPSELSINDVHFMSPPKRCKLETTVKKCRKIYGIDQRHLWCNQCKWKKACSRFTGDTKANM